LTIGRGLLSVDFSQAGSIPNLYRHDGIDANATVPAAEAIALVPLHSDYDSLVGPDGLG
jgi:hypothetical protein